MAKEEVLPDDLRCKRTDGRQWRCYRRVLDGKKLCQIHYLQGRRRQLKQKVPESLKLERRNKKTTNNGDQIGSSRSSRISKMPLVKKRKRCVSEVLDEALRKMKLKKGDLPLDLIREFLRRQVEKKKKKEEETELSAEAELKRELPNGVMAISQKRFENASTREDSDIKVGHNATLGSHLYSQRRFRSKNIEPLPISTVQVLPFVAKLRRRRKCHWCLRSNDCKLIKCLKCRRQFFCSNCIKQRYLEKQEVKVACPVCQKTCCCRICEKHQHQSMAINHKDIYKDKRKVDEMQLLQFLIHMLLPVLKQLNQNQSTELEIEYMITGKQSSPIQIKQTEIGQNKSLCCDNCKTSIVDYHRSCTNCSYSLCLTCCWEFCRGGLCGSFKFRGSDGTKSYLFNSCTSIAKIPSQSPMLLQKWEARSDGSVCCPPADFGGCGMGTLELRCIFPVSWTKKLESGAEELLQRRDYVETLDISSSHCSSCEGISEAGEVKLAQEMAKRLDSNDNFLYCPTITDLHQEKLTHFQQHWAKGHPVIVRNVLRSASGLTWDPVDMFCNYLEKASSRSQNGKDVVGRTTCLDWCEVEIATKQIFMGPLAEKTHVNLRNQVIKIKAWLSSQLFREQFPYHYAEVLNSLPIQEYVNPIHGHLNLALKLPLPQEKPKLEMGPCIHISYGSPEELMQADFLTKLCYDSYDVVNILAYATDVPIPREKLDMIKGLMKKYRARRHLQSNCNPIDKKGKSSLHGEESEDSGFQDLSLLNGISKVPFELSNLKSRKSCVDDGTISCDDSQTDSEDSLLCSGDLQRYEDTDDECLFGDALEDSFSSGEKQIDDSCAAQWDIFRREDVPKLLEYLKRHSDEMNSSYCHTKHVVHPIHDQNFFLDAFHKLRLKEEFDVQPWTFEQHPGEAIIIPAGCPYQIRKLKACVNVVVDFISPENAAECIRLTDEIRLLPMNHKAREKALEVRKMTVYGINAAIEEIHTLICKEAAGRKAE